MGPHHYDTHSCRGRGVQVDEAAGVRSHGVDGSVRAEAGHVDTQVGAALIHYVAQDIYLHLRNKEFREKKYRINHDYD